jgi:Iap family predicted aminopeptidase
MKKLILFFVFLSGVNLNTTYAQQAATNLPEFTLKKSEVEAHMRFLASDELEGRRTTDKGNNIAARYIAEQFRSYGLKQVDGADDFYQKIPFENKTPPKESFLRWNEEVYEHGKDMVVMAGDSLDIEAEVVFVNFGWVDADKGIDDYKDLDVKGKVVVSISGLPDSQEPSAVFGSMKTKRVLAAERGAVALVELYKLSFPWQFFKNYFGRARLDIAKDMDAESSSISYIWLNEKSEDAGLKLKNGKKTSFKIKTDAFVVEPKPSQNVIGIIEGSDPVLKNEYILCTAHYDHVGVGKQGGGAYTPEDSIFNGARDNAMGVIALLSAAKSIAATPTKRSIVFVAFTGEEMGLLGSAYYTENPLIPLNQTVLNLNTDGAGYDDKTAYSIIGYDRVGLKAEFDKAAAEFGLNVIADPAPEQNLFDRSDNVNFAAKGIPAPTVSPGTTGFSEEIQKYYHQVSDNPDSIDFDYLLTYCKAYAYLSRLVGNKTEAPRWKAGDKYENAAKALYGY